MFPLEVISGVDLADFNISTGAPQIDPLWVRDTAGQEVDTAARDGTGLVVRSGLGAGGRIGAWHTIGGHAVPPDQVTYEIMQQPKSGANA